MQIVSSVGNATSVGIALENCNLFNSTCIHTHKLENAEKQAIATDGSVMNLPLYQNIYEKDNKNVIKRSSLPRTM